MNSTTSRCLADFPKASVALAFKIAFTMVVSLCVCRVSAQQKNSTQEQIATGFEQITVTARKRTESLQEISNSIAVIREDTLERFDLSGFEEIADFLPNVTFNASPSGTPVIAVRGIGTRAGGAMLEQDVGLFVDGVWVGRQNQLQAAQFDVERIEMLRGTQATLYGRNSLVGAVSVTSKRPGGELESYISAGYEFEFDSRSIEGAISFPVNDEIAIRTAAKHSDQGGWLENITVNRNEAQSEDSVFRVTGTYEGGTGIEAFTKLQFAEHKQIGNPFVRLIDGTFSGYDGTRTVFPEAAPASAAGGFNEVAFGKQITISALDNEDVGATRKFVDATLQLDIPIGDHIFTSITGWSDMKYGAVFDPTILGGPRVMTQFNEDYSQFTQEVRLTSPGGENFDYIVGAFYVSQDIERLNFQFLNSVDRFWYGEQRLSGLSLFASGTYSVNNETRVIVGLRASNDDKDADIIVHGNTEVDLVFAQDSDTSETDILDGSLTIEYDANNDWLLFAGYGKGSKTPGLASGNPARNIDFVNDGSLFIPVAENRSSEIGSKYTFSNGYFNITGFKMNIDGFQQATFTDGNLRIDSIDIESVGIEIESFFMLTEDLSLDMALGTQDVENTSAIDNQNSDVPGAPKFSANLILSYDHADIFPSFDGIASLNLNHKGEHFLNNTIGAANAFNQIDAVTLLNLTLGVSHRNGLEFSFYVCNLTDQKYADFSFNAPGPSNDYLFSVAQPRTIGFRAKWHH